MAKSKNEYLCEGGGMTVGQGGIRLDEDNDKCCLVVPIELGVKIITLIIVLDAAIIIWNGLDYFSHEFFWGILNYLCLAPMVIGSIYFLQFLMNDTPETRAALPKGCLLVVLTQVCLLGYFVAQYLFLDGFEFSDALYSIALTVLSLLLFFYYMGVLKRFADKI